MEGKLTKPVRKANPAEPALDRPFDPALLDKARGIAARYKLVLEADPEVGFIGCAMEMPTVFADGATPDLCVAETREALTAAVATMLEAGRTPPAPISEGRRQEQINIRVSAEEKFRLQEAARSQGFRGVSDYVRATILRSLGS